MDMQQLAAHELDQVELGEVHGGQALVKSRNWFTGGRSFGFGFPGRGRGTVRTDATIDTHTVRGDGLTVEDSRIVDADGAVILEF